MATLALSTIGTALGGPVGGAIGSMIGMGIDQSLFGPGPRKGPRLNDLSVQTSSYGTPVPRIYGAMRVAGSIIWATELKESSEPQAGAKGQPDVLVYSYTASFAVALSSRAVRRIRRIWADGKLLRGAAGDFKVKTGFRFYPGGEDQEVDPLIASVEGIENTPAYRGLSLAIFEDLHLAEYGQRLPFLTFEIFADEGETEVGQILADASGGTVDSSTLEKLGGYAAHGSSQLAAVQPLIDQLAIPLVDDGEGVRSPLSLPATLCADDEIGCGAGDETAPRIERSQVPGSSLPRTLMLSYYDPARDYQTGQMRAGAVAAGGVDEAIELPATMTAERAKALAEASLARRWAHRDTLVLRLPPERIAIEPGEVVQLEDGSTWRVERASLEELVVRLELSRQSAGVVSVRADPGRHLPAPDVVAQPTVLAVLDLPDLGFGRHDTPTLQVAACQVGGSWRQVPIEVTNGSEVWTVPSASAEAIVGTAMSTLGAGGTVDVELADDDHWIESRDPGALANGANLAALGSEIIQFASAVAIGPKLFRLSGLVRGCRGTEWAMGSHVAGERFVLLNASALTEIVLPPTAIGSNVSLRPLGLADGTAEAVERVVTGEAMRPPSPIDLMAEKTVDGALMIHWTRRSRLGWLWPDGSEVPLGESVERYRVSIEGPFDTLTYAAMEPRITIPAEDVSALSGIVEVTVVQLGDFAESRPVSVSLDLGAAG